MKRILIYVLIFIIVCALVVTAVIFNTKKDENSEIGRAHV